MQEASRKPQIRSIARLPGLLLELAFRRLLDLLAAANRMLLASTSTARIRRLSRKPVWSRGFCLTDDHKKTDSPCRSMYLFLGAATAEEGLLTSKKRHHTICFVEGGGWTSSVAAISFSWSAQTELATFPDRKSKLDEWKPSPQLLRLLAGAGMFCRSPLVQAAPGMTVR